MLSQAIVEFGGPLKELETPTPVPQGTEVLIKTANAGVCHSDVHIHDGHFDLGVSQNLLLSAKPGQAPGVYMLELELNRTAGEVDNWVTVNSRFLANLRKQFLTWRTLSEEHREKYRAIAEQRFGLKDTATTAR